MRQEIDLDYDSLLGLLYEGPLQAVPWQDFLPAILQAMDAQVVSLILRPPAAGDRGVILNSRRNTDGVTETGLADPEDWEATTYREQFFNLDPFVNLPPGRAVTQRELIPDAELLASDYYKEYLEPIGIFHILGVDTVEPDGLVARLRIGRKLDEPEFSAKETALCERLVPHLQRAIHIHARLNRTESERDLYAGTVDQLAVATIIIDEQGRVHSCNSVAEDIFSRKDGVCLQDNRILIEHRGSHEALEKMIGEAIAAQLSRSTSLARAMRIPRSSGAQDLGVVVRPITASEWAEGQSSPCVAVFISDPQINEGASKQLLAELFELTPAEANLAINLAQGINLAEFSEAHNVSQHTARAQLKSIFSKTGVTRQAELVRLVLKSVASLG